MPALPIGTDMRRAPPPTWWWLGLAAMALLFALLRVMLEMNAGADGESSTLAAAAGGKEFSAGVGGSGELTALEAFLRSCLPPSGSGAEEWSSWAFFMADIAVMGVASGMAVWFYARPRAGGLTAASRIPLEDEGDV